MTDNTVTFKGITFELPDKHLSPDQQYVFMKQQLEQYNLSAETYQAAIKFICDLLDY